MAAVEVSPMVRGDAGAVRKFGYEVGAWGDYMPGKTGSEVAGLVMKLRELVGSEEAGRLMSPQVRHGVQLLKQTGVYTEEESLSMAVAGVRHHIPRAQFLSQYAGLLTEPMDAPVEHYGKRMSEEDRKRLALSRLGAAGRHEMFEADPGLRAKLMGLQGSEKMGEIPAAEVAGYAHQMLAAERAGLGPAQAVSQETELGKQAWRAGQAAVMGEEAREAMGPVGLIDTHYQRFYKEEADAPVGRAPSHDRHPPRVDDRTEPRQG